MTFRFSTGQNVRLQNDLQLWAHAEETVFRSIIKKCQFKAHIPIGCRLEELLTTGTIQGLLDVTTFASEMSFVELSWRKSEPRMREFDVLSVGTESGHRLAWFYHLANRERLITRSMRDQMADSLPFKQQGLDFVLWAQLI